MQQNPIYQSILDGQQQRKHMLAILVDPDKGDIARFEKTASLCNEHHVDFLLTGGSLITNHRLDTCIETLKKHSNIPVLLFPGNNLQISPLADGILLLSLISGRNPEMLIGQHVIAAPVLKKTSLEIIPTGYILVESGRITSVLYMSGTHPIPYDKPDIALCTALAGEMLGLKLIYLEAGSGADKHVSLEMIRSVKENIHVPLIVGGGIRTAQQAKEIWEAGADLIVVGNATEKDSTFISELSLAR